MISFQKQQLMNLKCKFSKYKMEGETKRMAIENSFSMRENELIMDNLKMKTVISEWENAPQEVRKLIREQHTMVMSITILIRKKPV